MAEPTSELTAFVSKLADLAEIDYQSDGDYRAGGYVVDFDEDEARRLIAARDARLLAEALRPFEELAAAADERGLALSKMGGPIGLASTAYLGMADRIRSALDKAKSASSGR